MQAILVRRATKFPEAGRSRGFFHSRTQQQRRNAASLQNGWSHRSCGTAAATASVSHEFAHAGPQTCLAKRETAGYKRCSLSCGGPPSMLGLERNGQGQKLRPAGKKNGLHLDRLTGQKLGQEWGWCGLRSTMRPAAHLAACPCMSRLLAAASPWNNKNSPTRFEPARRAKRPAAHTSRPTTFA